MQEKPELTGRPNAASLSRRRLLAAAGCALASVKLNPALSAGFSFEALTERARKLAEQPFDDGARQVAPGWKTLSYDQYRKIRFRRAASLWRDKGLFQLQLFHPGFYFDRTVSINILVDGRPEPLAYDPTLFEFADPEVERLSRAQGPGGYAGFRVHYPLNKASVHDEFAVFLGASYFRLIGRHQVYGLSARGLAVDTALPHGEEFPAFREFWIERPAARGTTLTLYALLDSPSVTGAYRILLRPRTATQADVSCVLFTRRAVAKLGIAPLTSMFLYGENRARTFDDFRPEVHDSDGLMLHAGNGEWLWRPLQNRTQLQVSSFLTRDPRGFGLIQRDRDFSSYQDLEAHYQRRPGLWVQPLGDWGEGRVELVEIPSDEETNDNIVCYWVSDRPVAAGQRLDYRFLLNAYLHHDRWPPGGQVTATRIGSAARPGVEAAAPAAARLFVIDFNDGDLPLLTEDQPVEAVVTVSRGRATSPVAQKNTASGGWRVFFDYYPDADQPADLRCYLKLYHFVLTETWNYLWTA